MVSRFRCCTLMDRFLEKDPEMGRCYLYVDVHYSPILREFYIGSGLARQNLFYCPWCGTKFPESLNAEYRAALNKRNIDIDKVLYTYLENGAFTKNDDEIKSHPDIPKEFKSDLWWKKRGL